MGQAFGVPVAHADIRPFTNLPKEALQSIWTSYNLLGEGWGLELYDFKAIFLNAPHLMAMGFTDKQLDALFDAFDTDRNGLVDALETLAVLALSSGMDTVEKVYFVHSIFDFNSGNALTFDETTLLLRSVIKGLVKICPGQAGSLLKIANMETSLDAEVEKYVSHIFNRLNKRVTMSREDLQAYSGSHPVVNSWISFCATFPYDAEEVAQQMARARGTDVSEAQRKQVYSSLPQPVTLVPPAKNPPRAARFGDRSVLDITVRKVKEVLPVAETKEEEEKEKAASVAEKAGSMASAEGIEAPKEEAAVEEVNYAAPWQTSTKRMIPDEDVKPFYRCDNPEDSFDKVWVHGYSGADGSLGTAVYAGSSIVYTGAQYALALTQASNPEDEAAPATWSQRALEEHSFTVRCLAVSADRSKFATGDIVSGSAAGTKLARIVIWDAAALSPIGSVFTGGDLGHGTRLLDFSRDGTLLLALSSDTLATVTMYDVASMAVVHTMCLGENTGISAMSFTGTNSMYVTAGDNGVTFYVDEGKAPIGASGLRNFEARVGLLSGAPVGGKQATAICKFELADESITGTATGHLLFWRGRSCIQSIKAHENAISRLSYCAATKTVASASLDGSVRTFKVNAGASGTTTISKKGPKLLKVRQLEQSSAFDIIHLDCPSRKIVALDINADGTKAVIGTMSGDIFEVSLKAAVPGGAPEPAEGEAPADEAAAGAIDAPKKRFGNDLHGGALVSSHWTGISGAQRRVTGLLATEGGFLTCGSDGQVRRWACGEGVVNKVKASMTCDSGCKTMATSANLIAVALDETMQANRKGTVQLYTLADFKFVSALEENNGQDINILRFSPDGNLLLVVTSPKGVGRISAYSKIEENWKHFMNIALEFPALSLDFSADGKYIRVVDDNDRMNLFNVAAAEGVTIGSRVDNLKVLQGAAWATTSTPCAWDTQGVFVGMDFKHAVPKPKDEPAADQQDAALAAASKVAEEPQEPLQLPQLVVKIGATARAQHLFLSGGLAGVVKVTRVPATQNFQDEKPLPVGSNSFKAHIGHIKALAFIGEAQDRLVTIGEDDGLVIVWKVSYDLDELELEPQGLSEEEMAAAAAAEDAENFGYDSAEEEDFFDGERLQAHLSMGSKVENEGVAVKDWVIYCDRGVNDCVGPDALPSQTPNDELELEWVYGYAARQTRNSVKYDSEGRIVYPAATFGVVLEKATDAQHQGQSTQHLCHAHHDELTCLDVHVATNRAASAHKGYGPISAVVWDTNTRQILSRVNCGEVGGVSALVFTPDGSSIIVACQDANHTVKVIDWRSGHVRASGVGGSKKILGFAISQANTPGKLRILQVGKNHFSFLEFVEGNFNLKTKSGKYGQGAKKHSVLCCASLPLPADGGNEFVLGMSDGKIQFVARNERTFASAQDVILGGAITALTVVTTKAATAEEPPAYKVICGGSGNYIKILTHEMEVIAKVNLNASWGPLQDKEYKLLVAGRVRGIKSLCVDRQARKILYGTSAGEIGEIDIDTAADMNDGPLVNSHFKDSLCGLMAHPIRQECLTAGDDRTLRVWNLRTHKLMTQIVLPDVCRCAAYAPNGLVIVAGLGGAVRGDERMEPRDFAGKVAILSYMQGILQIVHVAGDATEAISSVVFSPNGDKLYVSSMDSNIYVYDPLDSFKLVNTLKQHSDGVVSMDISVTGEHLLSAQADGEIVTWDLLLGVPMSFGEEMWKKTQFYCREGVRGFNSPGVYYAYHQAHVVASLSESYDRKLLATGDAFGAVRLFRNPAVQLNAPSKCYNGHTPGGVSRVVFTQEDQFLISVGRDDRCLMQWRLKKSDVAPWMPPKKEEGSEKSSSVKAEKKEIPLGNFAETFMIAGVDLSSRLTAAAEKPSEISAPVLSATIGMQGEATIAMYSGVGSVVTVTGKMISNLLADRLQQHHRNYIASEDNVGAVATSSCCRFIAVGSASHNGSLAVINSATGAYASILADSIPGGVRSIAFSHNGRYIAAVGGDERHTIYLYASLGTWTDAVLHWTGESSKADVRFITFLSGGAFDFVTGDTSEMKWWAIKGRNVSSESFALKAGGSSSISITTIVGIPHTGCLASGHANGSIKYWTSPGKAATINGADTPSNSVAAGESKDSVSESKAGMETVYGPRISALNVNASGMLISGSSAGIQLWNCSGPDVTAGKFISITDIVTNAANKDRMNVAESGTYPNSVCSDVAGQRLLISLNTNAIFELAIDSLNSYVVAEGELKVTTTAYCAHPTEPNTLVTGISSGHVKIWNLAYNAREVTGVLNLDKKPATALAFIDESTLAVSVDRSDTGGKSGAVFLVEVGAAPAPVTAVGRVLASSSARELKISKKIHNIGKGVITCIRSSPNGNYLACASEDGNVYLFDPKKDYAPAGIANCHASTPVVSIDWSADSAYLRAFGPTTAADAIMKLSFFSIEAPGTEESVIPLKDDVEIAPVRKGVTWHTSSSPAAFEAAGCHPAAAPGVGAAKGEVPSLADLLLVTSVTHNNEYLAAGYSDGSARVFKYPARSNEYCTLNSAQSASPVKVVYLAGGGLASISDQDGSIVLYK